MHFDETNWQGVEKYLQQDDRVMLILGASEQHADLSLLTDSKIPLALAGAASKLSGVIIAPPLHFGVSPYFLTYPGTISIQVDTYVRVVEDIIRSLYGYGFRRVLILNGHGGNAPAKLHLHAVVNALAGLRVKWYSWWLSQVVVKFAAENGLATQHANWMENFTFTRISSSPNYRKPLVEAGSEILSAEKTRERAMDGSYGGDYQVSDHLMQKLFDLCLAEVLEELKFN
ncbi:MAG: creatininase family protein [Chloroflexi bacterium]|nr:creatininase family protein [Chloroflexota bacterium]